MNINTVLLLAVGVAIVGFIAAYGDNVVTYFRGEANTANPRFQDLSNEVRQLGN